MLTLVLASCGSQVHSRPAITTVSGTNGPFYAVAAPATVTAGETVQLTLTASGPIQYETGCVQTLHVWAENSKNQTVWEEPVPAIQCQALGYKILGAGETATFNAQWPTSSQLDAGSYSLHGLFLTVLPPGAGMRVRENLPALTIEVLR